MTRLRRLGWKKLVVITVGGSTLLLVVFVGVGYALTDVPAPSKVATEQATRVLYADGSEMGRLGKNRVIVPLSKVSVPAQKAILAAEDREFYNEPGISVRGIGRALVANVTGGGVSQGGSTITQQYAKNAFLTQHRTFSRKIKEVFIAMKMSRTVSKDQVLEDYLNTIYFGRGAYGIEAAAETYFKTSAASLTPAQAAVLASGIRSPAGYDPARHLERAKTRWDYVLDGMVKQGWLTAAERAKAVFPKVRPLNGSGGARDFPGPFDYVREQVIADLEKHGIAEDRLAAGGLTITTTIKKKAQVAAIAAVQKSIPKPNEANPPVGALVAVTPGDGAVVAYYGGRTAGGYDYANGSSGVQPGSSFKPYVLAAALKEDTSLTTQYDGSTPQTICGSPVRNDSGDRPYHDIDLTTGLQHSVNTVYVRLACETGPDKVAALAHAAGIPDRDSLVNRGSGKTSPLIALGVYEVRVIDQAVGYATFAARGQRANPYFVAKVVDHGDAVYVAKPDLKRAFSKSVAADATYAMRKVVTGGTGTRARLDGRQAAGKTGTTTNNTNAWFCGFTPQLSASVWVGRSKGGPLKGVLGSGDGVYGGTVPAEIFKTFMDAALKGEPSRDFPPRAFLGVQPTPSATATATPTPDSSPSGTPTPTVTPSGIVTPTLLPSRRPPRGRRTASPPTLP